MQLQSNLDTQDTSYPIPFDNRYGFVPRKYLPVQNALFKRDYRSSLDDWYDDPASKLVPVIGVRMYSNHGIGATGNCSEPRKLIRHVCRRVRLAS